MVGAATFINPLLKVVTTVAILAAVYFFIVKPILDTTESTINRSFDQSAKIQESVRQAQREAQQEGVESFQVQTSQASLKEAQRMLACVEKAGGDAAKIQACNEIVAP